MDLFGMIASEYNAVKCLNPDHEFLKYFTVVGTNISHEQHLSDEFFKRFGSFNSEKLKKYYDITPAYLAYYTLLHKTVEFEMLDPEPKWLM
jgi:hypothetical protein